VEWNNTPPPLFFRPVGIPLEQARALLRDEGWGSEDAGPGLPCLKLEHGTIPAKILEVMPGFFQDPGAALVPLYADIPPGSVVGDLCAAPGGKTLAMASEGAYVLAADRSFSRLRLLKKNLARVGGRVELVVASAEFPPFRELPFLLLDVPCSGTGTFRRHPDARWRLTLDTLRQLVGLQGEMLDAGSRLVPTGGAMVYSTCTLEPEENHQQIEAFLSRTSGFRLQETGRVRREYLDEDGFLSVIPQTAGFDGAFAARLVRVS
jgi:16S rRNA (cytosine967-C5)-methyltransferase